MATPPNRWEIGATIAILALSVLSSFLGLFVDGHYADPAEGLLRVYAQDAVVLVVGVPVLAIALWLALRGSNRGRLVWLGGLAYMVYMWVHYAFVLAYNDFFLGYVALVGLSTLTLVSGLLSTDATTFHRALHDSLPERVYGGFLAIAAVGLAMLWLSDIVPAMLAGEIPSGIVQLGPEAALTYVLDLAILVPALAISAAWLLQGRPWGYVTAGVMLVFTALLAPTLTAITVVDLVEGIEMSAPIIIGSTVPPLVGLAFAGGYLHAVDGTDGESATHG